MKLTGTLQGDAARQFPRFLYRLPIMLPLDLNVDIDGASPVASRTLDVADYEIIVAAPDDMGLCRVDVWLVPHKPYTDATEPRRVYVTRYSWLGLGETLRDRVLADMLWSAKLWAAKHQE